MLTQQKARASGYVFIFLEINSKKLKGCSLADWTRFSGSFMQNWKEKIEPTVNHHHLQKCKLLQIVAWVKQVICTRYWLADIFWILEIF